MILEKVSDTELPKEGHFKDIRVERLINIGQIVPAAEAKKDLKN